MEGDLVRVLVDARRAGWTRCTGNKLARAPGVRLVLDNGRVIECSRSTPITQPDLSTVRAEFALGRLAAFNDGDGVGWSMITFAVEVGEIAVSQLSCNDGTYLAAMIAGEGVFTHNILAKP